MLLVCISIIVAGISGFLLGKYQERIAWNNLISKGVIPKPRRKNK